MGTGRSKTRTALLAAAAAIAISIVGTPLTPITPAGATPVLVPRGSSAIFTGDNTTCALTATNEVRCWGGNSSGEAGTGVESTSVPTPTTVAGLPAPVVSMALGRSHTCALTDAGEVWCWGAKEYGQTGTGIDPSPQLSPTQVSSLTTPVVALAAGDDHTCAVDSMGAVWCWGDNDSQQLGDGTTTASGTPLAVASLDEGVIGIAAGGNHVCALRSTGTVACWGANSSLQAGSPSGSVVSTPTDVAGLTGIRAIEGGYASNCALTGPGGLLCWGSGLLGRLGNGSTTNSATPVAPTGLTVGVRSVSVGYSHGCALMTTGAAKCWGDGRLGALGNATRTSSTTPVAVPGLTNVQSVTAGDNHTCVVRDGGGARCWGRNNSGQLGTGATDALTTPTAVPGVTGATSVRAGGISTCTLPGDGTIDCWGAGATGQLGDGNGKDSITPVSPSGITGATSIEVGRYRMCSVNGAGALKCWGSSSLGALGIGPVNENQMLPATVTGITNVAQVSAGTNHTCAVTTAGAAYCWGDNYHGELGDGTNTARDVPTAVSGLNAGVASITAGNTHTCAVMTSGTLRCWGDGPWGQLGNGGSTSSTTPVTVSSVPSGATAVATSDLSSCAIVSGAAKCWGTDSSGQLGNGSSASSNTPVQVTGLTSGMTQIVGGSSGYCALSSAGAVSCWGDNRAGAVGVPAAGSSAASPQTAIASGVVEIDGGINSMCARTTGGTLSCWGSSAEGQAAIDPGWTPKNVTGGNQYLATPALWAPFVTWADLVNQQYTDLLARTPTNAQRNTWVAKLTANSATPGSLVASLRLDADNTGAVDPSTRLYFAYFLRIPDKTGLDYWIGRKRGGMLLRTMSDYFARSSEFQRRYGSLTNAEFVELIYTNLFQRTADPAGATYWTNKLNNGSESRGGVMASFSEGSEYKRKMASEVTASVQNLLILRRQPSQAHFDEVVARLDSGALTESLLATEYLASDTYEARFS